MSATHHERPADALRTGDARVTAPVGAGARKIGGVAGWFDDRTSAAKPVNYLLKKVFPDHWSFMLGEIAMYSLIICLLTGVFLTFWFVPSAGQVVYDGSYLPLRGREMSEAFASTLDISFDIKGGLVIRQIHHWAALMFIVAIMVHMMRVFFTGAFRKPREFNWVIGTILSMLALVEGFAGYSLPDDLLSGTGLRAAVGFIQSTPVIGSYMAYAVFDGPFPGEAIIPRLYTVHVLLLPAILIALFTAHIVIVAVQKHTQYPGPGKTNENVVGFPVLPVYAAKAGGFFFIVFGVIALVSAFIQINAIWVYGPYDTSAVTAGAQPDWYMGFADGALRISPGWWEFEIFGYTMSLNVAIGALGLIPVMYTLIGIYPFLERWVTGDQREHHLLDRPRNAPTRTAIGMAFLTAYSIFLFAAGNDIIAIKFHASINDITRTFQVLLFVLPPVVFMVTKRICLSLQRHDRDLVLHGRELHLVRDASGGFYGAHGDLDEYERWTRVSYETPTPLQLSAAVDEHGVPNPAGRSERIRARMSRFWFKEGVPAVTPAELAAAHHDGHGTETLAAADVPEAIEQSEADRLGAPRH